MLGNCVRFMLNNHKKHLHAILLAVQSAGAEYSMFRSQLKAAHNLRARDDSNSTVVCILSIFRLNPNTTDQLHAIVKLTLRVSPSQSSTKSPIR